MKNCNILIISPEHWSGLELSKHHYAKTLAFAGFRVFFLNPPDDSLGSISVSPICDMPGVFSVSSPKVVIGLRFLPQYFRQFLEKRWIQKLEAQLDTRINVVWLFENSRFFDMGFAGDRLKIYHQVDLNQDLHPDRAAHTADICFCTSDGIRGSLLPHNPLVYKIHHGTALPAQPIALTEAQNTNYAFHGQNACYVGNLDMVYLDAELLAKVVQTYPTVRFHFIGGYSSQGHLHQLTASCPNVVWWGKVPSALIPAILERADIVLCTYKAAQYREQLASPHKFMEYLASGKTIVATYTEEYKDKRHLLEMVDDASDYVSTVGRVLADLPEYNSPARQAQRVAFALAHSYPKQLDKILSILKTHGLAEPFTRNEHQ
ncbi:glycosyltransferase [Hydrogenophaga sp.]|uniref:glycosyltransferase n=1 Tax=Hydrogenophaga sp. TaxID=1904254 RepID=UPI0027351DF3|nr:glycosyltransferase [Hydrogenophaga sp.]MDP3884874.1 glycosyltransferase [Hydrogenophaga sp.]